MSDVCTHVRLLLRYIIIFFFLSRLKIIASRDIGFNYLISRRLDERKIII